MKHSGSLQICVVGPSTRFLSGITYHTFGLCNALSAAHPVAAILLRQLLPTRLYPGRERVGTQITDMALDRRVSSFDGVDWYWFPTLLKGLWMLVRQRPSVVVMQWWTGTVLHTYLVLALLARFLRAQIVIEFHEVLDTGESRLPWASAYVNLVAPRLFRLASGYVVHSEFDRDLVRSSYALPVEQIEVIGHPTIDAYGDAPAHRTAPSDCCNLLFFGVIRPYKGLEDLVQAFDAIPKDEIDRYWLTIVGETWENWTRPLELIAASPYRDRITVVNRYVTDREAAAFFRGADVVVLPYHRSSQSGPLHLTFHYGLPVVVTAVGGLVEAVQEYEGAVLAEPQNPVSLLDAIRDAAALRGWRFPNPRRWSVVATQYTEFLTRVCSRPARQGIGARLRVRRGHSTLAVAVPDQNRDLAHG